ncbi:MAG: PAS domain-containing sensor histidine kinase [Gemmatimonadota bacterium]|nr:PAS domain-containing sensor histidine kinase [Gemmatimonadota bacterium]
MSAGLWYGLLILATVVMHVARDTQESQAHVVLTYLLIVLGGSVSGGRALGFTLAAAATALVSYYFQAPFDTFTLSKPVDAVVLCAFFATSGTTTYLLVRAQEEAAQARARAEEVERLSHEASHAAALREAARFKDILLASVSHDLRTPLTSIKALAQEAADSGDENATIIVAQTERLSKMVAHLLDMSRLNAGAFPVVIELNTAEDLVGAAVLELKGTMGDDRIRVDVDYDAPALIGMFDFVESLRILVNLLDNSLRYSPTNTQVELSATHAVGWLEFCVADRGPGIPKAEEQRVFEPFYRHTSTSGTVRGTGLGLAISRSLAEAQGGSLVYTARPGGGSIFTLRLRAVGASAVALEASPVESSVA